jgi:hypothetical protein
VLTNACKAAAGLAGRAAMRPNTTLEKRHLLSMSQTVDELRSTVSRRYESSPGASMPPPLLEFTAPLPPVLDATQFPLFGRLRRDVDVEKLAGESSVPPIVLPVQLTLVPATVSGVEEAAAALRHCVHVCTLLGHQRRLLKNTYYLRVALIQHLFTAVLPMPLPLDHPCRDSHCFWASQPMRYETQADILRSLNQVRTLALWKPPHRLCVSSGQRSNGGFDQGAPIECGMIKAA